MSWRVSLLAAFMVALFGLSLMPRGVVYAQSEVPPDNLCTGLPDGFNLVPIEIQNVGNIWSHTYWESQSRSGNRFTATLNEPSPTTGGQAQLWISAAVHSAAMKGYVFESEITNASGYYSPMSGFDYGNNGIQNVDLISPSSRAYYVIAGRFSTVPELITYTQSVGDSYGFQGVSFEDEVTFGWASLGGDLYWNWSFTAWAIVEGVGGNCVTTEAMPFPSTCTLVYTDTITSGTVTQTITSTQVVESNLLHNYSFETSSGATPAEWVPVIDGAVSTVPSFYSSDYTDARSGYRSVYNGSTFDLYQLLDLRSSGDYKAGFYADGDDARIFVNGSHVASSAGISGTYTLVSGIQSTGGGGGWLHIAFTADTPATYVDDVFLIPVDGAGDLLCDAAYYPDPGSDSSDCVQYPDSAGCVTVPTGGAGSTCYYCQVPPGGFVYVSYWIAWLGCVLRNLFACSLRVWLLVVGNWINGNVQIGLAFISWIPLTVRSGANWILSEVVPAITEGIGGSSSSSIWDALIALISLISSLISSLSNLMLGLVDLFTTLIDAIRSAFAVAPFQFTFGSGNITDPISGDLAVDGRTDSKILYMVFLGMGTVDSLLFGNASIQTLLSVVIGAVGLFAALWTLRYWKNFVSF